MQLIDSLSCIGYRGFKDKQEIKLAQPNGKFGGGLTILVGPNGGGKSTIIECFRKLSNVAGATFTEGKRNKASGDRVEISVVFDGLVGVLKTIDKGGASAIWASVEKNMPPPKVSFLPSRRVFNPYFSAGGWDRETYIQQASKFSNRSEPINNFNHRLFHALERYEEFSEVFERIYGRRLSWTIDQNENEQHYVKVEKSGNIFHNSDGMGEGLVSLLFLADAIFESTADEILVIDEPELSLHPQLQRRLMLALGELAIDRQVLLATHSPEMISVDAIINGMEVYRVVDEESGSTVHRMAEKCRKTFSSLEADLFNPHAFSYESLSCFFAEDDLVVTEGQEDVVFFNKMIADLGLDYQIPFWGFGAGGSSKIKLIVQILDSLGFKNISAIYDGDKIEDAKEFDVLFPKYKSFILPADDIRDKVFDGNVIKFGIYDVEKKIKPEHVHACKELLLEIDRQVNKKSRCQGRSSEWAK